MEDPTPQDVKAWLSEHALDWVFAGSRVTCDPSPLDTDDDRVVLVGDEWNQEERALEALVKLGFVPESGDGYEGQSFRFASFRRDQLNLLVTPNGNFFKRHRAATSVCRRLNLLDKYDRIAVFQAVLYGNSTVQKSQQVTT